MCASLHGTRSLDLPYLVVNSVPMFSTASDVIASASFARPSLAGGDPGWPGSAREGSNRAASGAELRPSRL